MRVCLVAHGFPPYERTGVENYTEALARAHARAGQRVEVFVPRRDPELPHLALRREERESEGKSWGLNWVNDLGQPADPAEMLDPAGIAACFGAFLERERPKVVHFQHVIKLGVGLLGEAQRRGIPVVYTAHDYYPVCHRFTLLRPDLTVCEGPGDPARCARCDLALATLNRVSGLGDYQQGAFVDSLEPAVGRELAATLAGDEARSGFSPEEWTAARELRTSLDARRAAEFAGVDLVVAPTQYLAKRLVEGGFAPERLRHVPYGIETAELAALERPALRGDERDGVRGASRRPVRFGYMGGLSKHKGVHVLVDAFAKLAELAEPAELVIHGGSSDAPYVARVRAAAEAAGALWSGPFRREELARCLEGVDVVVVPSIWVENYPFVIREAFAAGRPVVTSDLGALAESVEHGVDGLLVPPGDVEALAAALVRFGREPELLGHLAAGIRPVRPLEDEASELREVYAELCQRSGADAAQEPRKLPAHLAAAWHEWHDLDQLPSRELLGEVLSGLGALRERFADECAGATPEELLAEGLARHSRARVDLRDMKLERHWLRESLANRDVSENALGERLSWREEQIARDGEERRWLREQAAVLEQERDWLREKQSALEEEAAWLRETASNQEQELVWRRESIEGIEARGVELERELESYRAGEQALRERLRQAAEVGLAALQAQETVIGAELQPLFDGLDLILTNEAPDTRELKTSMEALSASIRRGVSRLRAMQDELTWRRREMQGAVEQSERAFAKLVVGRTGLGRRVELWRRSAEASERSDGPASVPDGGES